MSRFVFRLEPVLRYRRRLREQVLQMLAMLLRDQDDWRTTQAGVAARRQVQLDELRALGAGGTLDVDRTAMRRYHAGVLSVELQSIEQRLQLLAGQLDLCRQALARADRDVKLMEKLREKQQAVWNDEQEKRSAREREDAWLGAHWTEFAS